MSTRGWVSKEILGPRGAWTSGALVRKGNPARASVATNLRFAPGVCQSREGTSSVFTPTGGAVKSMMNWLSPSDNHLIYLDGTTAKRRKMSDGTTTTLASSLNTTQALSCADLGPRLYFCGFTTALAGAFQCRVYDGTTNVDTAFRGPLTVTSMTAVDGGAGQCTKGTHYFGFIFQSRSGFAGQPSPISGSVFAPTSVTLNAQSRTVTLTITWDTPADAGSGSAVYPIMTRASNPNTWYFVPDVQELNPTASAAGHVSTFTVSISDEDLAARAESAENQFNLLAQSSGSGPFNPNYVAAYGKRMTYGVGNKVYVSEIDDAQAVTEDFNVVQMPGQRNITVGFQFGQDYYMLGDRWTGRVSDNGDLPSTWATPSQVSPSIGTLSPLGVCPGKDAEWWWIASNRGLELFTGKYDEHPVSYFQSDIWARINMAAAYCIQIADDAANLRVHVAVPLDGATSPTHDLVFDYTQGKSFESIDFSLDSYAASTFGSIAVVKEASSARSSVFIGPSAAGRVLKLDTSTVNDLNPTTGASAAINAVWESSYIRKPGELGSKTIRVGNMDLWMRGAGAFTVLWKGFDGTPSVTPTVMTAGNAVATTLSSAPGLEYQCKGDLMSENYTVRVGTAAVDAYFSLSGLRPYYKQGLWTR